MKCPNCGFNADETARFCPRCGTLLESARDFILATTPIVPGYRVKRVLGVVTGLSPRTRGVGGRFVAGLQSMVGGEISAFTSEIEKARAEAIERMKAKAISMGANAVIGVDIETSDLYASIVLVSATGTAVILEPEEPEHR